MLYRHLGAISWRNSGELWRLIGTINQRLKANLSILFYIYVARPRHFRDFAEFAQAQADHALNIRGWLPYVKGTYPIWGTSRGTSKRMLPQMGTVPIRGQSPVLFDITPHSSILERMVSLSLRKLRKIPEVSGVGDLYIRENGEISLKSLIYSSN